MEKDLISVVIPMYNVESYIDQCIESVVKQSYRNLEIIIIDDASSDASNDYCKKWVKEDSRIVLRENGVRLGPGTVRNLGLDMAKGKYVIFLDSDDWMAYDFVKKMHSRIVEIDADFVASNEDYIVIDGKVEFIRHDIPEGIYDTKELQEIVLLAGSTAMWGKIYKKEWLQVNKLQQPETFWAEDYGAFPIITIKAKKIGIISNAGMYYRKLRNGSLTLGYDGVKLCEGYRKSIQNILRNSQKEFNKSIAAYCLKGYYSSYYRASEKGDVDSEYLLKKIVNNAMESLGVKAEISKRRYFIIGSFSLRWEMQKAGVMLNNISHYCFSSVISMMSRCHKLDISHKNAFRKVQLEQDISSMIIEEISEKNSNALLVIDFLEERFDIMKMGENEYITYSDIFEESGFGDIEEVKIIKSGTSEYLRLWEEKCEQFILLLKQFYDSSQIILIKNRMLLQYGDLYHLREHKDAKRIVEINNMISYMNEYFIKHFQGINVIDWDENTRFGFTDCRFQWGCKPEYANHGLYAEIGLKLFEKMFMNSYCMDEKS